MVRPVHSEVRVASCSSCALYQYCTSRAVVCTLAPQMEPPSTPSTPIRPAHVRVLVLVVYSCISRAFFSQKIRAAENLSARANMIYHAPPHTSATSRCEQLTLRNSDQSTNHTQAPRRRRAAKCKITAGSGSAPTTSGQ